MLDIVSSGDSLLENQIFISGNNMKMVSLCSVFLYTHHRAKLRREVTPSMKIVKT